MLSRLGKWSISAYIILACIRGYPQTQAVLKEVTVSAPSPEHSKTDNVIGPGQVVMPLTIIDKKTIALMGSRRLDELLREQAGLAIVSDLGAGNRSIGLQMQGFSSEYITILIDGQPMTGRSNGNFDLSRISIAGIDRIEIIKGASSSLYGSSALGGVVNIITKQYISKTQSLAAVRYGTNRTLDISTEVEAPFARGRGAAFLSGNYYRTDGFNVNPYLEKESQTSPPYNSLSFQGRGRYTLTNTNTLYFSGRFAGRHSLMTRNYGTGNSRDGLDESDLNGMVSLDHRITGKTRLIARYYLTRYTSLQNVYAPSGGSILQSDDYTEYIHRTEVQASYGSLDKKLSLISGAGGEYQAIREAHYYNYYGFLQGSYKPVAKLKLTAGLRYDGNTIYGGQLNPSGGISYSPVSWFTLRAAFGKGYKPPAYRQMYQVFTNMMQGYTVIGANVFTKEVKELQAAGLITQIWPIAGQVKELQPETSTSWNIGFDLRPAAGLEFNINAFYNNIHNLINTQQAGVKTNGSQLYSYVNIASAYTKGIEAGFRFHFTKGLTLSGNYQLLYAMDRSVIDSINTHSPRYDSVRSFPVPRASTVKDYFGLPDRSRHMANVQVFYEAGRPGISGSLRAVYRGKYGFLDTDNNGFIDPYDVFVKGYVLVNASIRKTLIKNCLSLQLSIDNIGNYTNYLMPAQPGRMILVGVTWQHLEKQQKTKKP